MNINHLCQPWTHISKRVVFKQPPNPQNAPKASPNHLDRTPSVDLRLEIVRFSARFHRPLQVPESISHARRGWHKHVHIDQLNHSLLPHPRHKAHLTSPHAPPQAISAVVDRTFRQASRCAMQTRTLATRLRVPQDHP